MRSGLIFSLVIGLLFSAGPADARINPKYLKRSQDHAAEKLVVKVLKVTVVTKGLESRVTAKAKVTVVRESQSGLKKGDRIVIRYTSRRLPRGATGPMAIRILSKGAVGAFLHGARSKGVYSPAARAFSFISARDMRKRKLKPRPVRRIKRKVVKRRTTVVRPAKKKTVKVKKTKTVKVKRGKKTTVKTKTIKTKRR